METKFKVGQAFVMLKKVMTFDVGDIVYFIREDANGGIVLLEDTSCQDWWCALHIDCEPYDDGDELVRIDPVNHPAHYTGGDIECIDAIKARMTKEEFIGFLRGHIIKYTWRMRNKGNPLQDYKKSMWYTDKLISVIKEE